MNSDIYEDININPSVVIKKIKFNDNTEIELNNDDIVVFVGANNVGKAKTDISAQRAAAISGAHGAGLPAGQKR